MSIKNTIKNILPYGVVERSNTFRTLARAVISPIDFFCTMSITKRNIVLQNIYEGERCFILCTGPTINNQPIEKLSNEFVFAVSTSYMHEKYSIIHPSFHCAPQITYSSIFDQERAIEHFRQMDLATFSDTKFIFSVSEKKLIEDNHLFQGKEVYYVYFAKKMMFEDNQIYDISKIIPGVTTVPIMALMLAMYMGFKKIYLLGVELDSAITKKYVHAFENRLFEQFGHIDYNVNEKCEVKDRGYELFANTASVLYQFRVLHQIAKANDIEIYNATNGGIVDEFPRVNLCDILNK